MEDLVLRYYESLKYMETLCVLSGTPCKTRYLTYRVSMGLLSKSVQSRKSIHQLYVRIPTII